jgi:diguanylate cyclase (GGDEF)-like protein
MDERSATVICSAATEEPAPSQLTDRSPYFLQLAGGTPGAMYHLPDGPHWVGRSTDSSICLLEASVSRRHALVEVVDSIPHVTDLGSTNGTYVNGSRLDERVGVSLTPGDLVRFGSAVVVKYSRPDPTEEQAHRELYDRAIRDPLTQLYNRRHFLEEARGLAHRTSWHRLGLAVLLLDIDHFKHVNDRFGHVAGDAALREVAIVMRQKTRQDDLVARYGGEEFICALPIATEALARERAELIRAEIESRTIETESGPLEITVSIGLAFAPPNAPQPLEQLTAAADRALYFAKDQGRNRVELAPESRLAELLTSTMDEIETC